MRIYLQCALSIRLGSSIGICDSWVHKIPKAVIVVAYIIADKIEMK